MVLMWISPEAGGRDKPPDGLVYSTVARLYVPNVSAPVADWSVVIQFDTKPVHGRPVHGWVRFLSPDAPQHLLSTGTIFELIEGKKVVAKGQVL